MKISTINPEKGYYNFARKDKKVIKVDTAYCTF